MKTTPEFTAVDQQYITLNQADVQYRELRALNFFWVGFIIYTAAYVLFTILQYDLILNKIQIVGLLLIVFGSFNLIRFRIENTYLAGLYILYCAWLLFTIYRGIKFDREFLFESIFNAWYGLPPYFVPVILLFPRNIYYLKKLFKVIIALGILFIIYSCLYRQQLLYPSEDVTSQAIMEIFAKTLSVPCGFLLLTYIYHSDRRKAIAFVVVILTLLLALIRGRRAITFMNASYLMFTYIIYLLVNNIKFSTVIASVFLIGIIGFAGLKFYTSNKKGAFSLITSRIDEDTRSTVEICLYNDMTTKDWIIGKGMMGEYYCPGVDEATAENNFTDYRNMIETDYLNIILKGGLVSLGLLLLILIPAVVKGLFYSKNVLSKAAAIWILLWIIDLYPATVNTFTLNYLLVWVCVAICYTPGIRMMPEGAIKEIFSGRV